MALIPIWCCALQRNVTQVTDPNDAIVAVVCPEFQVPNGTCRLKATVQQEVLLLGFFRRGTEVPIDGAVPRCRLA
jgi:hypothetical protein